MDDRSSPTELSTAGRPARRLDDLRVADRPGFRPPGPDRHVEQPGVVGRRSDDVESVSQVRTVDEHAAGLSALADPVRRRILDIIAEAGPQSASMLAKHFDISRQAVLKHLVTLEDARLVRRMPRGRSVLFMIDGENLVVTAQWLSRAVTDWALGRTGPARPPSPMSAAPQPTQQPALRALG